ncbi:hypothetical protein M9H77_26308 [Catharanthus roseus]|uniref:Uncharacterized protein n=1 Tax=Catharanthus roseus TaxID=4058 RepID=A0ACC0AB54_CATRO|nr:hypothetical protein M9H77_26308 [Catharanthus roseus]
MLAPHVTGIAALLKSAHPNRSPSAIISALENMRVMAQSLFTYAHQELREFAYWNLTVGEENILAISFHDEEANLDYNTRTLLIKYSSQALNQLIYAMYPDLIASYNDIYYLRE